MVLSCLISCAGLTHVTVPQSNVYYWGEDLVIGRKVSYTLTTTYVFGLGGVSQKARNTNIIDELFVKADLKKNESLAYISVSKNTNTYFGVVTIVKQTATGYVVGPSLLATDDSIIENKVKLSEEGTVDSDITQNDMASVESDIDYTPKSIKEAYKLSTIIIEDLESGDVDIALKKTEALELWISNHSELMVSHKELRRNYLQIKQLIGD